MFVVPSVRATVFVFALTSVACVSQSPQLFSGSGGTFVARGVIDAAGVFGRGCPERSLSSSRNVMECGSGAGGLTSGVEMANLGVSVARAALGAALWALDQTGPSAPLGTAAPSPALGLDDALSASRARLGLQGPPAASEICDERDCRATLALQILAQ